MIQERLITLPAKFCALLERTHKYNLKDVFLEVGYKLDLLVENKVIIEIKSIIEFSPIHFKQLTSYLKLTNKKLGLLVNFNTENVNEGIVRIANNL